MDDSYHNEALPIMSGRFGIPEGVDDNRTKYQRRLAIYLILASTLFERIAFYGLTATLTTTQVLPKPFQWHDRNTKTASYLFSGISYILPIIIAIITDAKLGRAKTIIAGFIWYLIGLVLVTVTASGETPLCHLNDPDHYNTTNTKIGDEKCARAILTTLSFTAIGAAAVKSNLAVYGAEQIQTDKTSSRYFDKYSIVVNFGSTVAILLIPFVKDYISVQNYFVPYLTATIMLAIAMILFCIGWKFYLNTELYETVAAKCIPVTFNALQSRYRYKKKIRAVKKKQFSHNDVPIHVLNAPESFVETEASIGIHGQPKTLLDFAKAPNGGKYPDRIVDDVKSLRSALVVFILLIPFWLIYSQVETSFLSQGENMHKSDSSYVVYYMPVADSMTTVIGLVIVNLVVYRFINANHRSATIATKMAIGMIFTLLSMFVAAVVEISRQKQCNQPSKDSSLSIYAQLPQYMFIGVSQLFGLVAGYEFAYFAAPRSAQSLFMSLHFCSIGIASFIGAAYINFFPRSDIILDFQCEKTHEWYWSFYTYFFILAGLQAIVLPIFIMLCKKYKIIQVNPQQVANRENRH